MTKIIAECGLNWVGPDDARALGLACFESGADYVKYQLITDPYRTARDRGMTPNEAEVWARMIPRMDEDDWEYVLSEIPREVRMVSVFSPNDVLTATRLRVDNIKIGHREHRLISLARKFARELWVTNCATYDADHHMICVQKYPCTYDETCEALNMYAEGHPVRDIKHWANLSDHSAPNLDAAHLAMAKGAGFIEVHVRPNGPGKYLDDAVSKSLADLATLCKEAHK